MVKTISILVVFGFLSLFTFDVLANPKDEPITDALVLFMVFVIWLAVIFAIFQV